MIAATFVKMRETAHSHVNDHPNPDERGNGARSARNQGSASLFAG
jgi:hypothetical protein